MADQTQPEADPIALLRAELEDARRREGELRSTVSALSVLLGGVIGVLRSTGLAGATSDFLFADAAKAARALQQGAEQMSTPSWYFSSEAFQATVALVQQVADMVEAKQPR